MKISKENLEADLRLVFEKIGKPPTKTEYTLLGKYGKGTIQRQWGSWNKALIDIFGEVNVKTRIPLKEVVCLTCNNSFMQKHGSSQKFCSRTCSTTLNNKLMIKRKKTKKCRSCESLIESSRKYCKECFSKLIVNLGQKTIEDIEYRKGSNRYGVIRQHAKTVIGKFEKICSKCGYNKHAEVCHKKPIGDFDKKTKLVEVNDPTNLIILCRNCHWELDKGII